MPDSQKLREIYGYPSGRARDKLITRLEKHSIHFIGLSPFVVISTCDKQGNVDTSPRGGEPGFVHVRNPGQIIIPDSKGNNRVDSMSNILETGRIGTLFLIPGINETLRVNGSAQINDDTETIRLFPSERQTPRACIVIDVEEIFLHCAKAFMRSRLWSPEAQTDPVTFPTIGQMLNDQLGVEDEPETREAMEKRYQADL